MLVIQLDEAGLFEVQCVPSLYIHHLSLSPFVIAMGNTAKP